MGSALANAFNIPDLRELAKKRLPKGIFDYVEGGTEDQLQLKRNRDGFDRLRLVPRSLIDVSRRTTETRFMSQTHAMPVAIAPTGAAGLLWFEGELAIAKAAAAANVPFTLALGSMTSMEKIAERAGGRLWFQLYMWANREMSHRLVARARAAGFEGLVVTVDTPIVANREYNNRNGFTLPFSATPRSLSDMLTHPRWLLTVLMRYIATSGMPTYDNWPKELKRKITKGGGRDPAMRCDTLTWDDIRILRDLWPGTFIVKGLMNAADAVRAFEYGADAVVVSNHGGRNVDSSLASIDLLPEVVDAVGGKGRVLLDSGIRRGSDIAKAIALGAHGVLIGRAPLYGAAVAGEAGASHALALLRRELDITMGLTGRCAIAELTRDLVRTDPFPLHSAPAGLPAE